MPLTQLLGWIVGAIVVLGFLYWANNNYVPEGGRKYGLLVLALIGVIIILWFIGGLTGASIPNLGHSR